MGNDLWGTNTCPFWATHRWSSDGATFPWETRYTLTSFLSPGNTSAVSISFLSHFWAETLHRRRITSLALKATLQPRVVKNHRISMHIMSFVGCLNGKQRQQAQFGSLEWPHGASTTALWKKHRARTQNPEHRSCFGSPVLRTLNSVSRGQPGLDNTALHWRHLHQGV